jgi:glycosyltransferase involved in cell wall biosynthesis
MAAVRVVIACDWFVKIATAQAAALQRAGSHAFVLCRDHAIEFGGDTDERRQTIDGARASGARVLETPGRLWSPAALPTLARIRSEIRRFAPDVIHVHEGVDPRAHLLLPRAPTLLTIHDPTPHPGQNVARWAPKRRFLDEARHAWRRRADVLQVHSDHLRAEVPLRRGQRCVVIPLGLTVRAEPLPPPSERAVGFFGRLEPYKGLDVLALAMPQVWAARPDVRLNVVGRGPSELALDDPRAVVRREYIPERELEQFFRSTSLAVLPYTQASQTAAGGVAIGNGIPVVASRVGGLADLALDDSYLFAAGDHAGLAETILRHIDDGTEQRERVLHDVAATMSWDACARRSLEIYSELLRTRTARR